MEKDYYKVLMEVKEGFATTNGELKAINGHLKRLNSRVEKVENCQATQKEELSKVESDIMTSKEVKRSIRNTIIWTITAVGGVLSIVLTLINIIS